MKQSSDPANKRLWAIRFVGATWLDRDVAYWTRRVLLWLGWLALTALVVAMTVGFAIGAAAGSSAAVIPTVAVLANIATFIAVLWSSWPTPKRVQRKAFAGRDGSAGGGATLGILALGSPVGGVLVALMVLLGGAGLFVAVLVLFSLAQLPEERIIAYRRAKLIERYGAGDAAHR